MNIVNIIERKRDKKELTKQEIDGIFQISLNDEGKCTYFKQWRFTSGREGSRLIF